MRFPEVLQAPIGQSHSGQSKPRSTFSVMVVAETIQDNLRFVRVEETPAMAAEIDEPLLGALRRSIVGLVRRDGPDLSPRQLAIFLTCYLETDAQTVRGLAAKLSVSKPAVSGALDRLEEFSLVRREDDQQNRSSVLIRRTRAGISLMRELGRSWRTHP
jgi:DNA-binding MarR family transcriptional regulator